MSIESLVAIVVIIFLLFYGIERIAKAYYHRQLGKYYSNLNNKNEPKRHYYERYSGGYQPKYGDTKRVPKGYSGINKGDKV